MARAGLFGSPSFQSFPWDGRIAINPGGRRGQSPPSVIPLVNCPPIEHFTNSCSAAAQVLPSGLPSTFRAVGLHAAARPLVLAPTPGDEPAHPRTPAPVAQPH